nr:hypothetical protein Q903MT_gene1717 [Picea sitchensis]
MLPVAGGNAYPGRCYPSSQVNQSINAFLPVDMSVCLLAPIHWCAPLGRLISYKSNP